MDPHTDETRVTAALPGLDVEIVFRALPGENAETLDLSLRATPGFESVARLLAAPMLPMMLAGAAFRAWADAARLAWSPWLGVSGFGASGFGASRLPPPAGPDRPRAEG